ncbi:hypothetical protein KEM55_005535, partial [Ascosphaera atra]
MATSPGDLATIPELPQVPYQQKEKDGCVAGGSDAIRPALHQQVTSTNTSTISCPQHCSPDCASPLCGDCYTCIDGIFNRLRISRTQIVDTQMPVRLNGSSDDDDFIFEPQNEISYGDLSPPVQHSLEEPLWERLKEDKGRLGPVSEKKSQRLRQASDERRDYDTFAMRAGHEGIVDLEVVSGKGDLPRPPYTEPLSRQPPLDDEPLESALMTQMQMQMQPEQAHGADDQEPGLPPITPVNTLAFGQPGAERLPPTAGTVICRHAGLAGDDGPEGKDKAKKKKTSEASPWWSPFRRLRSFCNLRGLQAPKKRSSKQPAFQTIRVHPRPLPEPAPKAPHPPTLTTVAETAACPHASWVEEENFGITETRPREEYRDLTAPRRQISRFALDTVQADRIRRLAPLDYLCLDSVLAG